MQEPQDSLAALLSKFNSPETLAVTQQRLRALQAYQDFENVNDINIIKVSRENIRTKVLELRQGASFLAEYLDNDSKPLNESEFNSYKGRIDAREEITLDLIAQHLTLRHVTGSLGDITTLGKLLPAPIRVAYGENVVNKNTVTNFGQNRVNYFTLSVGEHVTANFLAGGGDILTILLREFFEKYKSLARWLFVGPHFSALAGNEHSNITILEGTRFEFFHNAITKTKVYSYQRSDGVKFTRAIDPATEMYQGEDIFLGVGLDFLLHLRFIGNPFRENFLNFITDQSIKVEDRVLYLQKIMNILMPPDTTTEAKLPNALPMNLSCLKIKNSWARTQIDTREKLAALKYGDPEEILKTLMREIYQASVDTLYYCPLMAIMLNRYLSQEKKREYCRILLENGAIPFKKEEISYMGQKMHALELAIKNRQPDLVELILATPIRNPLNSSIVFRVSPHHPKVIKAIVQNAPPENEISYLYPAQAKAERDRYDSANMECLRLMIRYGYNIDNNLETLLPRVAACNITILRFFISKGHDLDLKATDQYCLGLKLIFENDVQTLKEAIRKKIIPVNSSATTGQFDKTESDGFESTTIRLNKRFAGLTLLHTAVASTQLNCVLALLELGANVNARTEAGETCLDTLLSLESQPLPALHSFTFSDTSKRDQIKSALIRAGANKNEHRTAEEKTTLSHYASIAIITGKNKKGEDVVVLGRKKKQQQESTSIFQPPSKKLDLLEYTFPGGFKDYYDQDFQQTAIRETLEETGLDLNKFLQQGKAVVREVHHYQQVSADGTTLFQLGIYHFDLGKNLQTFTLNPNDDLMVVHKVPLATICTDTTQQKLNQHFVNLRGEKIALQASNAILLEHLANKAPLCEVSAILGLELDGHGMLCKAAGQNNFDKVKELLSSGITLSKPKMKTTPMIEACKRGHLGMVRFLQGQGADLSQYATTLEKVPIFFAIAGRHYDIIEYLSKTNAIFSGMMIFHDAIKMNDPKIIPLMVNGLCHQLINTEFQNNDIKQGVINEALIAASKTNDRESISLLISRFKIETLLYEEFNSDILSSLKNQGYIQLAYQFAIKVLNQQTKKIQKAESSPEEQTQLTPKEAASRCVPYDENLRTLWEDIFSQAVSEGYVLLNLDQASKTILNP